MDGASYQRLHLTPEACFGGVRTDQLVGFSILVTVLAPPLSVTVKET
jgi:hypothetical protein